MIPESDTELSRRDFLRTVSMAAVAGAAADSAQARVLSTPELHEAGHYKALDGGTVQCTLCPWHCVVSDGNRGKCGVRENRQGRYYTLIYGRPCAMNNDPIEKKPLFHVYPGSRAFSIATVGCNIECKFCQNWDISQANPDDVPVAFRAPLEIVRMALTQKIKPKTIAYTYSEPTIFYEYMVDCAKAAKDAGLGNVMVSNGFIAEKPLKELCSLMTAIKIDLKAFSQQFYGNVCGGQLQPVLDTLQRLADSGVWFEIVVLVIPTLNDSMDEIKRLSEWIVKKLGPNVPLHFTRFHPAYKIRNLPITPVKTLNEAWKIATEQGCNFVYGGNMPGGGREDTRCPQCKAYVLKRYGHMVISDELAKGKCPNCGAPVPGVWA